MLAYIFPGQGVQKKGMGEKLFKKFPKLVRTANEILGYSLVDLCLNDFDNKLHQTEFSQPVLYTVISLLYLEKYFETALLPSFFAGHSLGEYIALFAAETFDFETGLTLVKKRAELMSKIQNGGMAAIVGLSKNEIEDILSQQASNINIANHNSPTQIVISGQKEKLNDLKKIFEASGAILYTVLNVSGPFHSPSMLTAQEEFKSYLKNFTLNNPIVPVIANYTGKPYTKETIQETLANQIANQVLWLESINYLASLGVTQFEEITPTQKILTKLVKQTLEANP